MCLAVAEDFYGVAVDYAYAFAGEVVGRRFQRSYVDKLLAILLRKLAQKSAAIPPSIIG